MSKPLEGLRVADFSHVMAGPYASHILKLLGAEVIKIESPGTGDLMRNYGPDRSLDGMAPGFVAVNAGKKSVTLNLKDDTCLEVARKLIETSDIILENFRPGVMAKFGLDFDSVRKFRPEIIYCSVSGYGQNGELRDWPAIDNIVQATSGMMSVSGEPDDGPVRVGFPIVDTLTGQTAAMAILAAIIRRSNSSTGEGEFIDVSMMDSSLAFMTSILTPYLMTGQKMKRSGNTGYSGQPTAAVFKTQDGRDISLGIVQPNQFKRFAELTGRTDWLTDPRFDHPEKRRKNFHAMVKEVSGEMLKDTGANWERKLSESGVPCGLVREAHEAVELPHVKGRSLRQTVPVHGLPHIGSADILSCGFEMSQGSPEVVEAPPLLGEHTAEVMKDLGFDSSQIDAILSRIASEQEGVS